MTSQVPPQSRQSRCWHGRRSISGGQTLIFFQGGHWANALLGSRIEAMDKRIEAIEPFMTGLKSGPVDVKAAGLQAIIAEALQFEEKKATIRTENASSLQAQPRSGGLHQ